MIPDLSPFLVAAAVFTIAEIMAIRHAYRRGWDNRGRELTSRVLAETRHKSSERI
ncbi:MAG: hypothetical protein PHQ12_03530 [Chthoniobacteraceae bacterium]|nr:hypothetical protein [Chthoniobacteraceae bacterium]